LNSDEYYDFHAHVFTKGSFELLIYDLNCLGFINLYIEKIFDVTGPEFTVSLKKGRIIPDDSLRLQMLKKINFELGETSLYANEAKTKGAEQETKITEQESKIAEQRTTIAKQRINIAEHRAEITEQRTKIAVQETIITEQERKYYVYSK
jgi:uncharacterized coiled-coil protein SlyX